MAAKADEVGDDVIGVIGVAAIVTAAAAAADNEADDSGIMGGGGRNSRRHVDGVNKRKSHGCSSSAGGVELDAGRR